MKITNCIHEILSTGYRIELAKAKNYIYFLIIDPERITELSGKISFSIEDDLFKDGPEDDICTILNSHFKVLKSHSKPKRYS